MRSTDWLQLALFVGALALITKPLGALLSFYQRAIDLRAGADRPRPHSYR